MYKVKVESTVEGMHPSEVEAKIKTHGETREHEYVFVDKRSMEDDAIKIGYPVGEREGALLV